MPIRKLPQHLINKLKAGEIVERPASIVKELIENALDAGADTINIDIVDGGKKLISIKDNGFGIDEHDIDQILERHTTSKIQTDDDMYALTTYGFRGEALASIAEVSAFAIRSKTLSSPVAHAVYRDNGVTHKQIERLAHTQGTVVTVNNLFHSLPARRKFLKSGSTERRHIRDHILNFIILHYDRKRTVTHNEKTMFRLPKAADLLSRISQVFSTKKADHRQIIEKKLSGIALYGILGDSNLTYGHRDNIRIFVNNRPVHDKIVLKALMQGYTRQLPPNQFPFALLFIEIDSEAVDINVHPRKDEVRFREPGSIYNFILHAVKGHLQQRKVSMGRLSHYSNSTSTTNTDSQTIQKITELRGNRAKNEVMPNGSAKPNAFLDIADTAPDGKTIDQPDDAIRLNTDSLYVIDQLRNMYIVCQGKDSMYLADQHAIAERILFERMKKKFTASLGKSEILLTPLTIENDQLESMHFDQYNALGFDMSKIAQNKLVVYAIPYAFVSFPVDLEKMLRNVSVHDHVTIDTVLDDIFATKACKAAIKAGDRLSHEQMRQLLSDAIDELTGLFVCQHGRTAMVKINKTEIDTLFMRAHS